MMFWYKVDEIVLHKCVFWGKHKLIGAMVNGAKGLFWTSFWSFNGIFHLIISSISSISLRLVQKIFTVVYDCILYSKYYQFQ
jgi:hypothetical protein